MARVESIPLEKSHSLGTDIDPVVSPPVPIKSLSLMEETKTQVDLGHLMEDEDD